MMGPGTATGGSGSEDAPAFNASGNVTGRPDRSAASVARARSGGPFSALRTPSFAWYLTGATLTNAATWIQNITVSWLVYDLTSSGTMLGTLNLVRTIATLGLATVAGVAVDRRSRRTLLYATNAWFLLACFSVGLVLLGNPGVVWPVFLFNLLNGIGQAVSAPLGQTVVFSIVPRSEAPNAVALVHTGWAVMRSIGPAIGGLLLLWFGPAGNFFAQAAAYALVVLTVAKLKLPSDRPSAAADNARGTFREGWAYLASEPTTLAFLMMSWALPLLIIPIFSALPPIYAKDVFSGGPDTLGVLMSAMGIGGIAGGFLIASLDRIDRRGLLQNAALLLISLAFVAFALSPTWWMAVVAIALAGLFEMVYITTNQTLIQLSIPDELRGRVTSIVNLKSALTPVGALIAGFAADLVGPRTTTLIFAATIAAVAIAVTGGSSLVRDYRLSRTMAEETVP